MDALILATDENPALRSLTQRIPAPMLPLVNRPVMAYTVEMLARAGCREIGVPLHRMAGAVEAYFGTGSRWGVRLTYLLQREALGSAGALRWAASGLRSTFVVLPGDAMMDFDIRAALAFHRSHGGPATLIVQRPGRGRPVRPVAVEPGGAVISITGHSPSPDARLLADTGAYIFEPQVLDLIPPGLPFDTYEDLLPRLLGAGDPVHAYLTDGYWNPLRSVAAYQDAQLALLASATGMTPGGELGDCPLRYPSLQGRQIAPGIVVGRGAAVHPAARLAPPVYIGAGCRVECDVELGPGAVLGSNVVVDEGATIRNSTVLERTYVGRLVRLDCRIVNRGLVIDAESGETLPIVDPFLLGDVTPEPIATLLSRLAGCAGALLLMLLWLPAIALIVLALLLITPFAGAPVRIFERRPRVRWRRESTEDQPEMEAYDLLYFRTRRDGSRFFPLGRWLERSQLDRLPSLWNVLVGDLRLVGVKPLDPTEAARLPEEWQRRCYERPAGFTGLWYVQSGGHSDLDDAVVADLYYTATRTTLEDARLLLRTSAGRLTTHRDPPAP